MRNDKNTYRIRSAKLDDLLDISKIEAICFPVTEACTKEQFLNRLTYYANHFYVLEDANNNMIGFVNGFCTDETDLKDIMYEDASMHNENGQWQMIFGVNVLPEYRRQGFAEMILRYVITQAQKEGRKGIVLTCKEHMIHYYHKLGFESEGISKNSVHGNVIWTQMRYTF